MGWYRPNLKLVLWFGITDVYSFKFDVFGFYPSISEELVTKSLKFADSCISVPNENLSQIKNACKPVLDEQ